MSLISNPRPNPVKRISCQQCDFKALDLQELGFHTNTFHHVPIQNLANKKYQGAPVVGTKKLHGFTPNVSSNSQDEVFENAQNFKCKQCSFGAGSQLEIVRHYKQSHLVQAKAPESRCDRCNFTSVDKSQFKQHIIVCRQAEGDQSQSYITDLVRLTHPGQIHDFSQNEDLNFQNENKQTAVQCCPHCDFKTPYADEFDTHMTNNHSHWNLENIYQQQFVINDSTSFQAEHGTVYQSFPVQLLKDQFAGNLISPNNNFYNKGPKIKVIQPAEYYKTGLNCSHCKFKTKSEKAFKLHKWKFHSNMLPKSDKVNKPQQIHFTDNFYTYFRCTLCHYKSLLEDNLTEHMSKKHSGNQELQTESAELQSRYPMEQVSNMTSETTRANFQLNSSDSFNSIQLAQQQQQQQLNEPEEEMVCSICLNYSSSDLNEMAMHFMRCNQDSVQESYSMNLKPEATLKEVPVQGPKTRRIMHCTKCLTFSTQSVQQFGFHFKECLGTRVEESGNVTSVEQSVSQMDRPTKANITYVATEPVDYNSKHSDRNNEASYFGNNLKLEPQKALMCSKCCHFNTTKLNELANHFKICNSTPNKEQAESNSSKQSNTGSNEHQGKIHSPLQGSPVTKKSTGSPPAWQNITLAPEQPLIKQEQTTVSKKIELKEEPSPEFNSSPHLQTNLLAPALPLSQPEQTMVKIKIEPGQGVRPECELKPPQNTFENVCSKCGSFSGPKIKLILHYMICKQEDSGPNELKSSAALQNKSQAKEQLWNRSEQITENRKVLKEPSPDSFESISSPQIHANLLPPEQPSSQIEQTTVKIKIEPREGVKPKFETKPHQNTTDIVCSICHKSSTSKIKFVQHYMTCEQDYSGAYKTETLSEATKQITENMLNKPKEEPSCDSMESIGSPPLQDNLVISEHM